MRVLKQEAAQARPPRHDRGRRLRRAGRGRGDHPPRAGGRSRGRAAELSPAAGDAGARRARRGKSRSTPNFRSRTSSTISPAPSRAAIRKRGVSAFITVQEGCDKFCTFCVVPYTRGAEVSRPVAKIVAEAERLADAGVREITLIGQNVNAYHGEGPDGRAWTLGRLLHRLADIPGIARLRYTTSHPRDMDDDLIAAHRDLPALMPQLHLPVQSGSDRILEAMNRRHTRADYLRVVERLRARAARHRVLVGFHRRLSGRDRGGFPRHAAADRRGRLFASAYSFKYSPRPGTPAADMDDQVAGGREERAAAAPAGRRSTRQQAAFNARCRGLHVRRAVREARPRILARSSAARPICSRCRSWRRHRMIGEIAPVTITEVGANSLFGALAAPAARDAAARTRSRRSLMPLRPHLARQRIARPRRHGDRRRRADAGRARLRRQPPRLGAVRPVRPEPRADRAPARRRRRAARQSRHARRLARRRRAGAPRAGRPLRAASSAARTSSPGDVEGAIRLAIAQGSLFDFDPATARPGFEEINLRKRPVRARTTAQDAYIRALRRHALVFGTGPAGTGKTWLAVAHAVSLFERKEVDRIILSRPAVEAGERLGFLPGDCARRSIRICARSTTRCTT